MKNRLWPCWAVISAVLLSPHLARCQAEKGGTAAPTSASPEMDRLAKPLAGNWNTTETMERSQFFPNGGSRQGKVHARLTAGGTALIYEVHSNGSAGPLDGMLIMWWDTNASLYRLIACFNNPDNPCTMRGTAHWEGDTLVNDYEVTVNGKAIKCQDSFVFGPSSHILVAAMDAGNGTMKTMITTRATRR